ncbi:putative esterase [Oxobacter pfennigii]|uniref:Putative esterase n=1 Tax=Oxobacter pfennigii TaxID=36849 RepID=A0A0P8W4C3_9CLOT|nr:thioesterase family protein [Oxobacter pfennigii]KPU43449.1 putative esterase [Oxobacter pfennigii]
MFVNENKFRVRYVETDKMGIVYHANYYVWFDMGRTEFLRDIGYQFSDLENSGLLFPLLETRCLHKKPARFDELLTVKTTINEMKGVRISFNYEVYNESNELIATGYTGHAFVDSNMRPLILKKSFPDLYEKLLNSIEDKNVSPKL